MPPPENELLVKLLLLGDSAVGKSSLLMRFCDDKFDSNFVLTIGVDFKIKIVERNNRKLKLQVWDTAGQERFRTLTPAYYKAAMGVVIAYDVTCRTTFEHVGFWTEQLEEHGDPSVQRILVGNKVDLVDHRQVTTQEGAEFAAKFNMQFFETSAKEETCVEDAFLAIADLVVAHRYANAPAAASNLGRVELTGIAHKKKKSCC
eukprot:TRINITY_DN67465_c0_g1_i1.p1 TRINITY_DN67465_c0_g1~~TRINITY_DN67465_c0_g1_i1.p1  ORF type:complete len:203 (-),score=39.84 TRINITY_DN67465_c0_g1_i1:235-843(-)